MQYTQVTIGFVVGAWHEMGQPALAIGERDEVTAIRNTALVADETQLNMPIHIGEPLLQFIESKSWNKSQPRAPQQVQRSGSSGEITPEKTGAPQLSLVTLDD
jgi:hypothetical protein